jgi:hypothetical protein
MEGVGVAVLPPIRIEFIPFIKQISIKLAYWLVANKIVFILFVNHD